VDELNKDIIELQKQRKVKYVDREEDPELKKAYEEEQARFMQMHEKLAGKIDGEIVMDMHGNVSIKPLDSPNAA
jgi:hypothetical protein